MLDSGRVHPDSADQEGTTPLMLAAINGQARVASLLLKEGADPNIRQEQAKAGAGRGITYLSPCG